MKQPDASDPLIQPERSSRRDFPIAEALRLIRTRQGLTQSAAGQLDGAPDFRTLSHWETRRKYPSLRLLYNYLGALGLDFRDLQDVLDQLAGIGDGRFELSARGRIDELDGQVERLAGVVDGFERRFVKLERRLAQVERAPASESADTR